MRLRPLATARKEFQAPDTSCFIRVVEGTNQPQYDGAVYYPDFTVQPIVIRAGGSISAVSDKSLTTPVKATKVIWYVNGLPLPNQTGLAVGAQTFSGWTLYDATNNPNGDYEFPTEGEDLDLIIHRNIAPGENINISAKVTAIDPRQGTGNTGAAIDMVTDTLPISCVQATVASVIRMNVTRSDFGYSQACDDMLKWKFYYGNCSDEFYRARIAKDIGLAATATAVEIRNTLNSQLTDTSADPLRPGHTIRERWTNDCDHIQLIGIEMTEGGTALDPTGWQLEIRRHSDNALLFDDTAGGLQNYMTLGGNRIGMNLLEQVEAPTAGSEYRYMLINMLLCPERTVLDIIGRKPILDESNQPTGNFRTVQCQATFYPDERPYDIKWSQPVMDDELTRAPIELLVTVNGEQQAVPERFMNFGLYVHHPVGSSKQYGAPYGGTNPATPLPQFTRSRGMFDLTSLGLTQTEDGSKITVEMGEEIKPSRSLLTINGEVVTIGGEAVLI